MDMSETIIVNTGEIAIGHNDARIRTGGIGSCVVVVLYDNVAKIGGVAHAMLPARPGEDNRFVDEAPAKFADESVSRLIRMIEEKGGKKQRLRAKLVGGAQMFSILKGDENGIGHQNVESARKRLHDLSVPIEGEDTGGTVGRLVEFDLTTGLVEVITKM